MRVLVVRLGAMGDVLHALPAVAALRAVHPDAYIGWAVERRWTPLLVADETPLSGPRSPQRPLVDHVHVVNTRVWRRAPLSDETWAEVRNALHDIRAERYDFAIDFQGAIKSAVVAQFSGAQTRIGFAQPREKPATMFYTSLVPPRAPHVIDQNFSLMSPLRDLTRAEGRSGDRVPSCSFVSSVGNLPGDGAADIEVERKLAQTVCATDLPRPEVRFVILNPGAGWPAKQWPVRRYAEVARTLRDDEIISLVNYGPGEETLAREVEAHSDGAAHPISCTLGELISLTRRALLFIGGDTGPLHLAAAVGVPVVALFGPTDPARNGPCFGAPLLSGVGRCGNSIVLRHPSSRTDYSHKNESDPGLLQISAEEVLAAARTLLTESRKPKAESRS